MCRNVSFFEGFFFYLFYYVICGFDLVCLVLFSLSFQPSRIVERGNVVVAKETKVPGNDGLPSFVFGS